MLSPSWGVKLLTIKELQISRLDGTDSAIGVAFGICDTGRRVRLFWITDRRSRSAPAWASGFTNSPVP